MASFARALVAVTGIGFAVVALPAPPAVGQEIPLATGQEIPHPTGQTLPSDAGATRWLGADDQPLPFTSDAQIVDFLTEADVVSMEKIPQGTTEPRKVLLERGGVRAHAVFRDVDLVVDQVWLDDGSFHMKLRDSAIFEVAAYRLAALLGLDNVPPAVVRRIDDTNGSLQLWVENAVTEEARRAADAPLPDRMAWFHRFQAMFLFDHVIGNVDRNMGNYLTDAGGKLWMIDHTRAFQQFLDDWDPLAIGVCQRRVWEGLQALDGETLRETLSDLLTSGEINALTKRRDALVAHLRAQIDARGERAVIIDAP